MCNLYRLTSNQEAMRHLFAIQHDTTGNLALMPGIFPDYEASIVLKVDSKLSRFDNRIENFIRSQH